MSAKQLIVIGYSGHEPPTQWDHFHQLEVLAVDVQLLVLSPYYNYAVACFNYRSMTFALVCHFISLHDLVLGKEGSHRQVILTCTYWLVAMLIVCICVDCLRYVRDDYTYCLNLL